MYGNPTAKRYRNHVWLLRGARYGVPMPRRVSWLAILDGALFAAACLCAGLFSGSAGTGPGIAYAHRLTGRVDQAGLCYVTGLLNGVSFEMLADSGSTSILLGREHLALIGVNPATLHFTHTVIVANGAAKAAEITLQQVRLGGFDLRDVPALVVDTRGDRHDDAPLLGTQILRSMRFELGGGKCTLSWP
jgi:aspartyl protease family protein